MIQTLLAPVALSILLMFILGFVTGQSIDLGWGLPLGTSLTCLIAALGLVATLHHSYAARKHNRLSVRPHLIFNSQFNSGVLSGHQTFTLKVKNVGLGPAIIEKYIISFEGTNELNAHTVFEQLLKMVNNNTPAHGKAHCKSGFLYPEHAVDKGEEQTLIEISLPTEGRSFMQGREIAKKLVKLINSEIRYKCHYGTKFNVSKMSDDLQNKELAK